MSTGQKNRIHNRRSEGTSPSEWQQQIEHCQEMMTETVRENPIAATMIVFGVGLGIGTVIGSLLVDPAEHRRRQVVRSLGQRMLDSVSDYMPDRLQQHLPR